ncbi:hypothetical protein [Desulfovibrio oxyclinae]|uniref:hypothetical protein n=1 Tax=Desulfovibrio oxyclinae TaxID=63560 RepID=UPI0003652AF8|nr:hypothetical protein [Desulfovibrio oxyclinae]
MNKYVRPATIEDIKVLAPQLRSADVEEVRAAIGEYSVAYLERAFYASDPCYVMLGEEGDLVGIYGVVPNPLQLNSGAVWMHCTDTLEKYPFQFLRRSREGADRLHDTYDLLYNFVDARNTVHIKWLRWSGFKFINYHPNHGKGKRPFYEFVRIRPCVKQ